MTQKSPVISVVMPVYNEENFLPEAIESILNQTFEKFEFIIIDDGSTDRTSEIIKQYHEKDDRIFLIQNENNLGLPASLNKGIRKAQGKYIARQDADDLSIQTRLEKQYNYMEQKESISILGSDNYRIDVTSERFSENVVEKFNPKEFIKSHKIFFAHGTAFMKRKDIIGIGLYNEHFYYSQDRELWYRAFCNGLKIDRLNELLYSLRLTEYNNHTKKNYHEKFRNIAKNALIRWQDGEEYGVKIQSLRKIRKSLSKIQGTRKRDGLGEDYWFFIGRQAIRSEKYKSYGRKCISRSFKKKPTITKLMLLLISYFPITFKSGAPKYIQKMWK